MSSILADKAVECQELSMLETFFPYIMVQVHTIMWEVNEIKKEEKKVKTIRIAISAAMTLIGVIVVVTQLVPVAKSYIKAHMIKRVESTLVSPLPGSYRKDIDGEFAYWDPGKSYFENLRQQVLLTSNDQVFNPDTGEYTELKIDTSYSAPMRITIEALNIKDLYITPNVESFDQEIYNETLKKGLAHFKGTALPGDGGNSFIYGHSAITTYYKNHSEDPEVAFTILEDISIGDKVLVKKDGKIYTYIVRKKKIVSPTDFSILSRQSWKETLTLMTCSPVGIGTDRLIVTAELSDG